MSYSSSKIWIHLVFYTRQKAPLLVGKLKKEIKNGLEEFLSENCDQPCAYHILPEHIHLLINLSDSLSAKEVLKKIQSKIQDSLKESKMDVNLDWEEEFHVHSVSATRLSTEKSGIMRQELIHQEVSLEEEMKFLGM